jgi:hypothetical protein
MLPKWPAGSLERLSGEIYLAEDGGAELLYAMHTCTSFLFVTSPRTGLCNIHRDYPPFGNSRATTASSRGLLS